MSEAKLRIENEELRERVRQLEQALCPPATTPVHWNLTPTQERMFHALSARESMSFDALALCVAATLEGEATPESIRVHICGLRRKIRAAGYHVRSVRYLGYRLETPYGRVADRCVAILQSFSRELRGTMQ